MSWGNIDIDLVKQLCMFNLSSDVELKEAFNCKWTQSILIHIHQQEGTKFIFLDYQSQFIKAYQFIKLGEEGYSKNLQWWDTFKAI